MNELVTIRGLDIRFNTYEGIVKAVDNVDLDIFAQETLGLVGETGCGKTVTALSLLGLISSPGKITSGDILFYPDMVHPINLRELSEAKYREIRGSRISMIFQEPSSALNPVFTIGDQISEVILLHRRNEVTESAIKVIETSGNYNSILKPLQKAVRHIQKKLLYESLENPGTATEKILLKIPVLRRLYDAVKGESIKMSVQALKDVDIPDAERIVKQYPHQMSGGMKQRVVIAIALACSPKLLIADEPTTSLDVTIQFQIIQLLRKLKAEKHSSILYITHDLAVAAEICDRIGVMYAGSLVEVANVKDIFAHANHPYTIALLAAVPKPGFEPKAVEGFLPDPTNLPTGCKFHPRCPFSLDICRETSPSLQEVSPGHFVACHNQQGNKHG